MPLVARFLGLLLVLWTHVGLPAQTLPRAGEAASPWPSPLEPAASNPSAVGVVQAGHQAPASFGSSPDLSSPQAPPFSAPRRDAALPPLSPPGRNEPRKPGDIGRTVGLPPLLAIGSGLAVVLGLFFVFAWVMRRTSPTGLGLLPGEVLEVLGRAPLAGRQQLHLLRCGRKLLLVCVTPDSAETLTEITDPQEVDYLAGLCRQSQPGSSTAVFRHALRQFAGETADTGRGARSRATD